MQNNIEGCNSYIKEVPYRAVYYRYFSKLQWELNGLQSWVSFAC